MTLYHFLLKKIFGEFVDYYFFFSFIHVLFNVMYVMCCYVMLFMFYVLLLFVPRYKPTRSAIHIYLFDFYIYIKKIDMITPLENFASNQLQKNYRINYGY